MKGHNISRYLALASFLCLVPVYGQRFELTPLVGARFGGTVELAQGSLPHYDSELADSMSFGVAAGIRILSEGGEGHDIFEFRWMRQNSHLAILPSDVGATPNTGTPSRPKVSLDHFFVDLSHEYTMREAPIIRPFVSLSVGAARMSTPESSATRFAMGLGGGVRAFPSKHFGFRLKVEYLPIVMHASAQAVVCSGGCVIVLSGGVMNQFEVSLGPAFRF